MLNVYLLQGYHNKDILPISAFLCVLIMVENISGITVIVRSTSLRTKTFYFVTFLALTNTILGVLDCMILIYFVSCAHNSVFVSFAAPFMHGMIGLSMIQYALIAVERYLYITKPFFYRRHVTRRRITTSTVTLWAIVAVFVSTCVICTSLKAVGVDDVLRIVSEWVGPVVYTTCTMTAFTAYLSILVVASRQRQAFPCATKGSIKLNVKMPNEYSARKHAGRQIVTKNSGLQAGPDINKRHSEIQTGPEIDTKHPGILVVPQIVTKHSEILPGPQIVTKHSEILAGPQIVTKHSEILAGPQIVTKHSEILAGPQDKVHAVIHNGPRMDRGQTEFPEGLKMDNMRHAGAHAGTQTHKETRRAKIYAGIHIDRAVMSGVWFFSCAFGFFFVMTFPGVMSFALRNYIEISTDAYYFLTLGIDLNSAADFFILTLINKEFRRAVKNTFVGGCAKCTTSAISDRDPLKAEHRDIAILSSGNLEITSSEVQCKN